MDEAGYAHVGQGYRSRILDSVNSALYEIPVERRRKLAATLGLFAVLFVTVGIVATTGSTPGVVRVFSAVALSIAAVLALTAWGISHSVKLDLAEERLDRAIDATMKAHGGSAAMCGCGHEHDPDEMHIRAGNGTVSQQSRTGRHEASDAEACAHDGSGTDCTHNCVSCVLRTLRPSPTQTREERLGAESA
jgi:hypothetical protein